MYRLMENKVKRIGYLPRKRVLEIIDEISKSESISRSKVVGILVEEALDARGIANFGYSNASKSNIYKSDNFKDHSYIVISQIFIRIVLNASSNYSFRLGRVSEIFLI